MKSSISVLLACLALLASNVLLLAQEESEGQEVGSPSTSPYPSPIIPLSMDGSQSPSPFGGPIDGGFAEPTEEQKKCLDSFMGKNPDSDPCLHDLSNSFQTQRISINPPCCVALEAVDDSCKRVFYFDNPMFQMLVQQYCSGGPTADSGSEIGSGYGDQTGLGGLVTASGPDGSVDVFGFGSGPAEGPSFK